MVDGFMSFKLDKINNRLMKGKKVIKKTDLKSFAQYAIQQLNRGVSLNKFPEESENIPLLASVLTTLETNFPEEYAKAEEMKMNILKEQLIEVTEEFRRNPSKEKQDIVTTLEKAYSSMLKNSNKDRNVIVNFHDTILLETWEKVEYENPITDKEKKEWEDMLDGIKL